MASIDNLVHETSTTTGTGDFTLTSANGKQTFNTAFGTGVTTDVFYYFIGNQSAAEWEVGTGHMSDATTLVRDTVLASSNSGSAVNFSAGTKDVTNDVPASRQLAHQRGHLFGLGLSNNGTDGDHDIDIAAGQAASGDSDAEMMILASALTKRIDATWAVGTGNGGLDTGTVANTTWYHVHLIKRIDTGVVDALFSTSPTAPTMPANYTKSRRIGAVRTNSSANIIAFTQWLDKFEWSVPIEDLDEANPGTTADTRTLTVPTGIRVEAIIGFWLYNGTNNLSAYASSLSVSDQAPHVFTTADLASPGAHALTESGDSQWQFTPPMRLVTNTSAQIRTRASASGASDRMGIITYGWIDDRGKLS